MAMTKSYHTVNGRILGETSGGVRTDYLTDALGSVTATVDQNAQVLNTYRYKPYGGQLAKSGIGADPKFRWVGNWGYRETGRHFSDLYVRARHYGPNIAAWSSRDPIPGPVTNFYLYASCGPTTLIDPTGLEATGENYVKVLTMRKDIREVAGSIATPVAISISPPPGDPRPVNHESLWHNEYVSFYLSFANNPSSTQYDCGISFTCHDKPGRGAGWAAWLVGLPRGARERVERKKPLNIQCGATVAVRMSLIKRRNRYVVTCSVAEHKFEIEHGATNIVPIFHGQVTIGASSGRPKHSIAAWGGVSSTPSSAWPHRKQQGDYTVYSWWQLVASKGIPATTDCVCIGERPVEDPSLATCNASL